MSTTTAVDRFTAAQSRVINELALSLPDDVGCGPHTAEGAVNAVTARSLLRRGLVLQTSARPSRYTLSPNGALLALASLAGWDLPADIGDGYVVEVCADSAVHLGIVSGWDRDVALARVNALLDACGHRRLEVSA